MPRCENWKKVDLTPKNTSEEKVTEGKCSRCNRKDKMYLIPAPALGNRRMRIVCPRCVTHLGYVVG